MLSKKFMKHHTIIMAVIVMMAMIFTSCSFKREDDTPPTAPVLTVSKVSRDMVSMAWSESYDDGGIEEYRLYRDGSVLVKTDEIEYDDKDVEEGAEYEYYVVAYDESGNRSSKSVKQLVKVTGGAEEPSEKPDEPTEEPGESPKAGSSIQSLSRSTVKIYILDNNFEVFAGGSGTILNKDGYILTNFHCVGENGALYNSEGYVGVAITDDVKKNIQPQYIAQFRSGSEALDLAVIKIVSDLNWNPVSAADMNLVPAKLADSDKVELGDDINILGYPGVGFDTITFTSGHISGFIDEDNDSEIDWIKTDAIVNHGNSGGTAVNKNGEMIGVPTAKITGNDQDIMYFLKPVNQAIPIYEEALAQGDSPNLPTPSHPQPGTEEPVYGGAITISGRIVDAYTERPIYGAAFILLKDGVTIQEFANNPQDSMILTYGETGRDGIFICYDVPCGGSYSVIIGADGYIPILEDYALGIPSDWTEDVDLGDIYLEAEY